MAVSPWKPRALPPAGFRLCCEPPCNSEAARGQDQLETARHQQWDSRAPKIRRGKQPCPPFPIPSPPPTPGTRRKHKRKHKAAEHGHAERQVWAPGSQGELHGGLAPSRAQGVRVQPKSLCGGLLCLARGAGSSLWGGGVQEHGRSLCRTSPQAHRQRVAQHPHLGGDLEPARQVQVRDSHRSRVGVAGGEPPGGSAEGADPACSVWPSTAVSPSPRQA